jgi:hypothetical protein
VQVAEFWALKSGHLDDVDAAQLSSFEHALRELAQAFAYLEQRIRVAPTIDDDLARDLGRWAEQAKARLHKRG